MVLVRRALGAKLGSGLTPLSLSLNRSPVLGSSLSLKRSISKWVALEPLNPILPPYRRSKIICTVGPASWDDSGMVALLEAGMNVMRINCSHGNHELYAELIGRLRKNAAERRDARGEDNVFTCLLGSQNTSCAVALDTKGPEIRLGDFEGGDVAARFTYEEGDKIAVSTNPAIQEAMTKDRLFVDYANIGHCVTPNESKVFIDDGLLSFSVVGIEKDKDGFDVVQCVADNSASIGSRKGVNLPGAVLDLPAVSEKDREDLRFAREQEVDYIFASFVRRREHVDEIREIVGPNVGIISKIENAEGIDNIDGIIEASDGIMVARGDLGIEIPQASVFLAQKMMAGKCNLMGKPVITATQMLDSMTRSPRPTRAECSDVANAILDGSDAVMLSGETANGVYPSLTVKTMSNICRTAEYSVNHRLTMEAIKESVREHSNDATKPLCEALVVSAVVASFEEKAKLILVLSETGISARLAAKYRPEALIVCITSNEKLARQLQLCYGVKVHVVPKGMGKHEAISSAVKQSHQAEITSPGDMVVIVDAKNQLMKLQEVPEWVGIA